jgi:hypothetical protein
MKEQYDYINMICEKYGMPSPHQGEYWDDAITKIANLVRNLDEVVNRLVNNNGYGVENASDQNTEA